MVFKKMGNCQKGFNDQSGFFRVTNILYDLNTLCEIPPFLFNLPRWVLRFIEDKLMWYLDTLRVKVDTLPCHHPITVRMISSPKTLSGTFTTNQKITMYCLVVFWPTRFCCQEKGSDKTPKLPESSCGEHKGPYDRSSSQSGLTGCTKSMYRSWMYFYRISDSVLRLSRSYRPTEPKDLYFRGSGRSTSLSKYRRYKLISLSVPVVSKWHLVLKVHPT